MIKIPLFVMCMLCCSVLSAQVRAEEHIVIDLNEKGSTISPSMYGVFFEEINHAGDGGLYAELVQNRSFEDGEMLPGYSLDEKRWLVSPVGTNHLSGKSYNKTFPWYPEPVRGWSLSVEDPTTATMTLTKDQPLFSTAPNNLKVTIAQEGVPVSLINEGYWGMNVMKGKKYLLRAIVRRDEAYKGTITAKLINQKGESIASAPIKVKGSGWNDLRLTLTAKGTDSRARLAIEFDATGVVWLDYVSLFPKETFNGRPNGMRRDVAQTLAGLQPAFFRWPGGCVVEGITLDNRFDWKRTLGDPASRPGEYMLWGYRTTYGMGYHEILQYCEDIGAKTMYVCNVGMDCTLRLANVCSEDSVQYYLDDCLDAIEYAIGDVTTTWGARRAANGHPKPFPLQYVEIGNENWGPVYEKRFNLFYETIKARYPQLTLIYNIMRKRESGPIPKTDMIDPHWYVAPDFFFKNTRLFDKWERGKYKVYVGEYACNGEVGSGNMYAALSEAAFIGGMERNGDLVTMASYAPLFENSNNRRWKTNLIWIDTDRVMGRSSYYVQKMAAENRPTYNVKNSMEVGRVDTTGCLTDWDLLKDCPLQFVATGYDETARELVIKVVNASKLPYATTFELQGATKVLPKGTVITLRAADGKEENTLEAPTKIVPVTEKFTKFAKTFGYTFAPFSYTILRVKAHH